MKEILESLAQSFPIEEPAVRPRLHSVVFLEWVRSLYQPPLNTLDRRPPRDLNAFGRRDTNALIARLRRLDASDRRTIEKAEADLNHPDALEAIERIVPFLTYGHPIAYLDFRLLVGLAEAWNIHGRINPI